MTQITLKFNNALGDDRTLQLDFPAVHRPMPDVLREAITLVPDDAILCEIRIDGDVVMGADF